MKTVHLGCGSHLICATLLLKPQGTNASISKLIQTSPLKDVETEFSGDKMSFQRSLRIEVGLRIKNTHTSIQSRVHLRTCILFLFACFHCFTYQPQFPFPTLITSPIPIYPLPIHASSISIQKGVLPSAPGLE